MRLRCPSPLPPTLLTTPAGLGFHVEATLEEAPRIIAMRKAALQAKVHGASEQVGAACERACKARASPVRPVHPPTIIPVQLAHPCLATCRTRPCTQCARIRAHIRLVEQALGELQAITPG